MDYWFMPSPSASDGGSDNASVAAAAVWMRTLAGMLLPMLSTAAAAGQGSQVAAQDQRALQAGADCLSSAAGTRPGTQTRVRARPAQITRRPCSAAGSASASTSAKPPEVLPAEQLGGARVLRTQLQRVPRRGDDADAHADAHAEAQCRAGAHMGLSYKKNSIIIVQTSHHTRHKSMILRPMMITKGRDITGVNITAYA